MKLLRTQLSRRTAFHFACSRCLRCCHGKDIQVNPYEIGRLAGNRGMSTTAFIGTYTAGGGTLLNWGDRGACVFLDSKGCGVHQDRPLVCRLYPLGRHVRCGQESFSEIQPHSQCEGVYGEDSSIEDYLHAQGTGPFIEAADRYLDVLWRLVDIVQRTAADPDKKEVVLDIYRNFPLGRHKENFNLMDMDAVVSVYCEENRYPFPVDVHKKMSFHIKAIEAWILTQEKGDGDEKIKKAKSRKTDSIR